MANKSDISLFIGKTFGDLTILKDAGIKRKHSQVEAVCKCGVIKLYLLDNLKRGTTKSCGCYNHRRGEAVLGTKYNRLTIIKNLGRINNKRMVLVLCECGSLKEANLTKLISGHTKSCGCLHKQKTLERTTKHSLHRHPLYRIFMSIKARCYNEKDKSYKNYGGRGIVMCDEWRSDFKTFYDWAIANGWQKGLDLDKDIKAPAENGKIYSPDYCLFVNRQTNLRKKRNNKYLTHNGMTKCISEWCEYLNMSRRTIEDRLSKKWPIHKVLMPLN